jgi:putative membrane protein
MYLTRDEAQAIEARIASVESKTGVQVVTAVVGKSDTYVELPWKAFALGASVAATVLVASSAWRPDWITAFTTLLHATVILGAGAACAVATVLVPTFARPFLGGTRAEVEVRQFARSMFLEKEIFGTRARTAVLVLVSLFERQIAIVADTGFGGRVTDADWHGVVACMRPWLRRGRPSDALADALAALEALLSSKGFTPAGAGSNELPDRPIEEAGA